MPRVSFKAHLWWARPTCSGELEFVNCQLWQCFSRLERVTGIEPALSAWELLELYGYVLGSVRVSRSRAAWSVPRLPAVMARQWHAETSVVSPKRPLLANSRLYQRLLSLSAHATQLAVFGIGSCRVRCRTYLEYESLIPEPLRGLPGFQADNWIMNFASVTAGGTFTMMMRLPLVNALARVQNRTPQEARTRLSQAGAADVEQRSPGLGEHR
jgi:hypothetical protein